MSKIIIEPKKLVQKGIKHFLQILKFLAVKHRRLQNEIKMLKVTIYHKLCMFV